MQEFFVLKHITTGKYYSENKIFDAPNKLDAKRLRQGQAEALKRKYNKYSITATVKIESADEDE